MDFSGISTIGWIVIAIIFSLVFLVLITALIIFFNLAFKKNIKLKHFSIEEVQPLQKELYFSEGKNQLENQCQVAKLLMKELRIKLYITGEKIFNLTDQRDKDILELITYRIVDRLIYDLRNDLTRNHITSKTDEELDRYSEAKANGYYIMIKDRFYIWNSKIPNYDLRQIIERIPKTEITNIFKNIYFSARDIAGLGGK
jgi:hypothetical protein